MFTDTFTDVNGTTLSTHVGEGGTTWTRGPTSNAGNNFQIQGNGVRRVAGAGNAWEWASWVPSNPDYWVEAPIHAVNADVRGGPVIRSSVNGAYGVGRMGASFKLVRFNGTWSTFVTLGTYSETAVAGTTKNLRIQAVGSSIKVFVDGVERISATDTNITDAGSAGIYMESGGTDGTIFESVTASNDIPPAGNPIYMVV